MAQTTGAMNFRAAKVQFGATTAGVVDISSELCAVAPGGGESVVSASHTADGDFPTIAAGKIAPRTMQVRFLYTEAGTSEAFDVAQDIWQTAGRACFLRYTPSGGTGSEYMHKTASAAGVEAAGIMSAFEEIPPGDVDDTAMLKCSFTVTCERILTEAVS